MPTRQFIIADRQPLFRTALKSLILRRFGPANVDEAHGIEPLLELLTAPAKPDLVLVDPCAPFTDGLAKLESVLALHPGLAVVVVSELTTSAAVDHAMEMGASAFIPKTATEDEFAAALDGVITRGSWVQSWVKRSEPVEVADITALMGTLSRQQARVLKLLGQGLLNKQIAYGLGIGETTVKAHISAILKKLGASNRTQAAMMISRIAGASGQPATLRAASDNQAAVGLEAHGRSI